MDLACALYVQNKVRFTKESLIQCLLGIPRITLTILSEYQSNVANVTNCLIVGNVTFNVMIFGLRKT